MTGHFHKVPMPSRASVASCTFAGSLRKCPQSTLALLVARIAGHFAIERAVSIPKVPGGFFEVYIKVAFIMRSPRSHRVWIGYM